MTVPQISVVVPFYDNEDLLGDCLQSIAAQTFTDLEVIMVDDGSADGSAAIAQRMAAADPRFRLIRVRNGGPGYARNRGIEHASGEFLAFVDADDMLPSHAYEILHHTLLGSGSDFASGNVLRVGPSGTHQSALHSKAIKGRRIGTHISKTPQLLYDVSVWNKLFRKAFWDRAGLVYPEGMLWEDLQIMTRAHVLATAVDVITDPIYYRRELVELAGQYLDQVDKRVIAKLPSTHKLAFYLVRQRALDRLLEFNRWQVEQPVRTIPVLRKHGRLRADLPFLGDRSVNIPVRVYRPYWRELDPFVRVEGVSWRGSRLVITGCAYVPSIAIPKRRHTSKIVVLRPRGVWRPARVHTPVIGPAERPEYLEVAPGMRFGAHWVGRQLHVGVIRTPAVLRGSAQDGGRLTIDMDVDLAGPAAAADLVLAWSKGAATRRFAGSIERRDGGPARLRAVVPVDVLTPVAEIPADAASAAAAALGSAGAAEPEPGEVAVQDSDEAAALDSADAAAPEP